MQTSLVKLKDVDGQYRHMHALDMQHSAKEKEAAAVTAAGDGTPLLILSGTAQVIIIPPFLHSLHQKYLLLFVLLVFSRSIAGDRTCDLL